MKFYGHLSDDTAEQPISLREVTICADSEKLRLIASFLMHAASLMETHQKEFGHEHLKDWWKDWPNGLPDLIVERDDVRQS